MDLALDFRRDILYMLILLVSCWCPVFADDNNLSPTEKDRSISQEGSRYFNEIAAHRYQVRTELLLLHCLRVSGVVAMDAWLEL